MACEDDIIRLVGGDDRPRIILTLTDENNNDAPIDVSAGTTVVYVKLRATGKSTVLATITAAKDNGGADGVISFGFTGGVLDIPAGSYEFEISIDFAGETQTVYDVLPMRLRAPFS